MDITSLLAFQDSTKVLGYLSEDTFNTLLGAGIALFSSILVTIIVQWLERKKWKEQRDWEIKTWNYNLQLENIDSNIALYEELIINAKDLLNYFGGNNTNNEFYFKFTLRLPAKHLKLMQQLDSDKTKNKVKKNEELMSSIIDDLTKLKNNKTSLLKEIEQLKK